MRSLILEDDKGREIERFTRSPYGSDMSCVKTGAQRSRSAGQRACLTWGPPPNPYPRREGRRHPLRGHRRRSNRASPKKFKPAPTRPRSEQFEVIEHKGEMHPRIVIDDKDRQHPRLPLLARQGPHRRQSEGDKIEAGHMLARQPRAATSSADIVGGLPRVTEIFEARKPKEAADHGRDDRHR